MIVASVQYELCHLESEADFWAHVVTYIQQAIDGHADLIVFPEYVTAHLLTLIPETDHRSACAFLNSYTPVYTKIFQKKAMEHQLMILAGTHICATPMNTAQKKYRNQAFLFFPDGRIETQAKLHLTPEEQKRWPLVQGNALNIIETNWGRMAILTCYDIEFPELARLAAEQDVRVILCPSYTDQGAGYYRVRTCCQARAIENQLFVVLGGLVGQLAEARAQVDRGYCQAGVFAPCDYPFPADGILAVGETNQSALVLYDLDFDTLCMNRTASGGAVAPFFDRRSEWYDAERKRMKSSEPMTVYQ
jgi:predicted amidohydrolase